MGTQSLAASVGDILPEQGRWFHFRGKGQDDEHGAHVTLRTGSGAGRTVRISRNRDVSPHGRLAVLPDCVSFVGTVRQFAAEGVRKLFSRQPDAVHGGNLIKRWLQVFECRIVHLNHQTGC